MCEDKNCAICQTRPASKKNSHVIPSYLIATFANVDESTSRDKELLYTISPYVTNVFIGRSVMEEELKGSFDSLSDEDIKSKSKNPLTRDYVFCPHCESKLAQYLESPWKSKFSPNKILPPDLDAFFWLSVLWRISYFNVAFLKLPKEQETGLKDILNEYIERRDNGDSTIDLLEKLPYTYKVLYSKDFCKNCKDGLMYAAFDMKLMIATIILGDYVVSFNFSCDENYQSYVFYGIEEQLSKCADYGHYINVENGIFQKILQALRLDMVKAKLEADEEKVKEYWCNIRELIIPHLPVEPSDDFIKYVLARLNNNLVKPGVIISYKYFAKSFRDGLEAFYNIHVE